MGGKMVGNYVLLILCCGDVLYKLTEIETASLLPEFYLLEPMWYEWCYYSRRRLHSDKMIGRKRWTGNQKWQGPCDILISIRLGPMMRVGIEKGQWDSSRKPSSSFGVCLLRHWKIINVEHEHSYLWNTPIGIGCVSDLRDLSLC